MSLSIICMQREPHQVRCVGFGLQKSTLRPALPSFGDNVESCSMEKVNGLVSFQQQSTKEEANTVIKRNEIGALKSHIEEGYPTIKVGVVDNEYIIDQSIQTLEDDSR